MSSSSEKGKHFQLRIEHLWGLVILVGIFVFVNTHPIRPHDFWWHITIGREILTSRNIPSFDIYSYTEAGQPYPSYQMFWLMEVLLYEIYKLGGPALIIFIHSMIITAAYGILFLICKQQSNSWRFATSGVIFAAAMGLNDWNVRPQGITFLIASIFLLAMDQYSKKNQWKWLILLPLGMLIWVNSHGTFLIGLVLVAIWWGNILWEALRQRIVLKLPVDKRAIEVSGAFLLITALACLINPRGLGIIDYVRTLSGNPIIQNLVTEWAPPTFNSMMGSVFLIGLMGIALVLALSPKRLSVYQAITFLVFGILGLKTSRGIVWFGIVMAPVVVDHLSAIVHQLRPASQKTVDGGGSPGLNYLFAIIILGMGIITLPWFKSILPLPNAKAGLISTETPVQATDFLLAEKPPGHLFNSMSFGSYLIWAAYPQYQVFVDSRIELFSEKVWMDYLNISNASGAWEELLNEYGVNTLMLSPDEQPGLLKAVNGSAGWHLIYQDEVAYLFTR